MPSDLFFGRSHKGCAYVSAYALSKHGVCACLSMTAAFVGVIHGLTLGVGHAVNQQPV